MKMLYYLLEFPVGFLFLRWLIAALSNNLSSSSSSSSRKSSKSLSTSLIVKRDDIDGDLHRIGRDEMEIVMGAVGLHEHGQSPMEYYNPDQLCGLFEEKEPSLDEVKQAFLVFDENGDGFIDAIELQSVLTRLEFIEGAELEECNKMIRVYDENKDGKIDFSEFVKFMELSFCWHNSVYVSIYLLVPSSFYSSASSSSSLISSRIKSVKRMKEKKKIIFEKNTILPPSLVVSHLRLAGGWLKFSVFDFWILHNVFTVVNGVFHIVQAEFYWKFKEHVSVKKSGLFSIWKHRKLFSWLQNFS